MELLFKFFSAFDILELFFLFLLRLIIINKSNITQNKRMKPPPTAIAINVGPEKRVMVVRGRNCKIIIQNQWLDS